MGEGWGRGAQCGEFRPHRNKVGHSPGQYFPKRFDSKPQWRASLKGVKGQTMSQQKSEENSAMEMHVFYIFKYILDEVEHTFYCSISGPFFGL